MIQLKTLGRRFLLLSSVKALDVDIHLGFFITPVWGAGRENVNFDPRCELFHREAS